MSFIDVLEEVFEGGDGGCDFDIDVAVVFRGKERIVRYNVSISEGMSVVDKGCPTVSSPIQGVAIAVNACVVTKRPGVAFGAFAVTHTRTSRIGEATRPM